MSVELVWNSISKLDTSNLIVFGSVATRNKEPFDLDVVLDARDYNSFEEAMNAQGLLINSLLLIARRYYGYLDPFVLTKDDLMVRNDHATGWTSSKNKNGLINAILVDGIKFDELPFQPQCNLI